MIGTEIFAGVGGMSLGATMAGIAMKLAVEIDPAATVTFKHNHKDTKVINKDVRDVSKTDLMIPASKKKEPSVFFGGPPCQGFSRSNKRTRTFENPNNWLFEEFIRLAKLSKADWVVIENVPGLADVEGGYFLEEILDLLDDIGYEANFSILNAMDFGVPQNRERLFIVGSRDGIAFDFPSPSIPLSKITTVSQALSDLPSLTNGNSTDKLIYKTDARSPFARMLRGNRKQCTNNLVSKNTDLVIERYRHIPQGGNWSDIPRRLMHTYADCSRCHTGIYHRLDNSKPAVVIGNYRKNMLIHPKEDRGLSVREAARLQSFPDSFQFKGALGSQQQHVGNAVPPLLAKAVFKQILAYQ